MADVHDALGSLTTLLKTKLAEQADLGISSLTAGGAVASLIKSNRSYWSIPELAEKWECTEEALYDLALQGLLKFSAPAVEWRIRKGHRKPIGEKVTEVIEDERIITDLVLLPSSAIIPLIKMKECIVEELWAPEGRFARVMATDHKPLPKLLAKNVKVTVASAEQFLKHLANQVESTSAQNCSSIEDASEGKSAYTSLTTDAIANLFKLVKDDPESGDNENKTLWRKYAHHAKRNGLLAARAPNPPDQGRKQSFFYPDKVGEWIVTSGLKPQDWVERKLEKLVFGSDEVPY